MTNDGHSYGAGLAQVVMAFTFWEALDLSIDYDDRMAQKRHA